MLCELSIRNIAIIDRLVVSFQPGFTVLTGETGAGKSIIVDAVSLLIGGRGSAELIRSGCDDGGVDARFEVGEDSALRSLLADRGIDIEDELVIKRVISRTGKNRCYLNGSLSTLSLLTEVGRRLINIYGQHESQTLLERGRHRDLLDRFGEIDTTPYRERYDQWRQVCRELEELEKGGREAAQKIDLLTFQRDEILSAALEPGEEERLRSEREILRNGERLLRAGEEGYDALYGSDDSVVARLAGVIRLVGEGARIDPTLGPILAALEGASAQIDDAARELKGYASRLDIDPSRIDAVEERLHQLERLFRKYGGSSGEVLAFLQRVEDELSRVEHRDERIDSLRQEKTRLEEMIRREGESLARLRREAATRLCEGIRSQFADLAMPHGELVVHISTTLEPGPAGFDDVEFLFAPNPGEGAKPLARIASGGELSRIMLALKQLLPERDVPTLVFDEVDSGIGGKTAALVGEKLAAVARGQQVLCITHLPAVAASATHHHSVRKEIMDGRTTTRVVPLDKAERVEEIARMLGGREVTDTTRAHAREMLARNARRQREISR
ncbi:MAG: DNA repair protein RecN [Desulfuromonadia bacterium]